MEADICLSQVAQSAYGFPSAIRVRPLNTAPEAESSTARNAWVDGDDPLVETLGFQPEIVPASVAKMKMDEPLFVPALMSNDPPPLNTTPVVAAVPVEPAGGGIVTKGSPVFTLPALSKSDDVPTPLLPSQKSPGLGAAGPRD